MDLKTVVEQWPDTPFEESMIKSGVIIHCPDKDLVYDLFEILKRNGIRWYGGMTSMDDTCWNYDRENTCYRVLENKEMKRGNVYCYQGGEYRGYIKCTFYGVEPDFEISDAEFEAIISAGG